MAYKKLDRDARPLAITKPTKCAKCGSLALWHVYEFLCPVCGWTDYQEVALVIGSISQFNTILKDKDAYHIGKNYVVLDKYENILKVKKVYVTKNRNTKLRQGGDWHKKYLYDLPAMMVLCPTCHININVEEKYKWSMLTHEVNQESIMPYKYKSVCVVNGCKITIKLVHYRAKAYLWWEIK